MHSLTSSHQVGPLLGGGPKTQPFIAKRHTPRLMTLRMADDAGTIFTTTAISNKTQIAMKQAGTGTRH